MKKIAFLVGMLPNPRNQKRLALESTVAEVSLVCWNRKENMVGMSVPEGIHPYCIDVEAAPDMAGSPLKRLIPFCKFFRQAKKALAEISPDVIHAENLDMLCIALSAKRRSKKPVRIIYEIPDLHGLVVDEQKSPLKKVIQFGLRAMDKALCRQVDLLILTSPRFFDVYYCRLIPMEKMLFMPNAPEGHVFDGYQHKAKATPFTIGFIGQVFYKQQALNLVEAAKRTGVHLLIAGYETDGLGEVEEACRSYSDGEWFGRYDFRRQAAELYGKCDVIHLVYDADMENVKNLLPNKLYEAVRCELPVIVAKGTYLSHVVEEWGVGLSVDHRSVEDLIEAIERLRSDTVIYEELKENCRRHRRNTEPDAYHEKFTAELLKMM